MLSRMFKRLTTSLLALALAFYSLAVVGQNRTDSSNSIVLDEQTEIVCKSATQAVERYTRTVTILNKKGLDAASFICGCDQFRSLDHFSGEVMDASGTRVRKIKKSELQRTEYSSNLTTDDYTYYYECNYPTFPFTVKYEWGIKCNNGLIVYSPFVPQKEFWQRVEKATYRLTLPVGQTCHYFAKNTENKKVTITETKGAAGEQVLEVTATGWNAIVSEPLSPDVHELLPLVYFVPTTFVYDKTQGSMLNWKDYGDWQYKLLEGRDQLPEPFIQKLKELTASCKTDREKVKVVYDYLGETTRYVSIQLGIGGLQPIPAAEVCRTGFGDCKGLSNYTRAMLKALGIPSVYTVISTVNKRLIPNFASVNQMNHVILQVPLPQDTLWLECTNPKLPFGYVHQGIGGHDALLVTPEGGRVYRLPTYPDSLNTQETHATVEIASDGSAKITAQTTSRLLQYENEIGIKYLDPAKQKDALRQSVTLNQATVEALELTENKASDPEFCLTYRISSQQYGNRTGNRLFIPINIFRKGFTLPQTPERINPVCVDYGYNDVDSIHLKLPEGYTIEGVSLPVVVESKFGRFSSTLVVKDRDVFVVQHLFIPKGTYPPEEYAAFIDFRKQINRQYSGRIILKKQSE